MDAVEYVKQRNRMCYYYPSCSVCLALVSEEYRDDDYNCCMVELKCGKCKRDFWLKEIE